ncbi:MAG TPA: hypothetical protein VGJ73_17690 [Verrucomicrobiae bacterium]
MKRPVSNTGLAIFSYTAKIFISLAAIAGLLMALHMVVKAREFLMSAQQSIKSRPPLGAGRPAASTLAATSVVPLWPEYPHNGSRNLQSVMINGVQVITEQWDCGNSSDEVLSYYHDQMTARGWEDTTEQSYSIRPELRPNSLDDPKFIEDYRNTKASNLMFSRGDWTLHISTAPSRKGFRQTTVKFYAAQTSSFLNLAQDTAAAVLKSSVQQQPMDVLQSGSAEDYHTTITTKNEPPQVAFQDALEEEIRQGWKPTPVPQRQSSTAYFAWLTKGQRYSALSVQLTRQGASSVTLVEVTPH